jgi:hypothetical protein
MALNTSPIPEVTPPAMDCAVDSVLGPDEKPCCEAIFVCVLCSARCLGGVDLLRERRVAL